MTVIVTVVKISAGMLVPIVLARLITPHDFGLAAMALPILAIGAIFAAPGVNEYILRMSDVSAEKLTKLFWFSVVTSTLIYAVVVLASHSVAGYYREPNLSALLWVGGLVFLFTAPTVIHGNLSRRYFRHDLVAVADVAAAVVSVATGIFLAWLGLGYWVLILIPLFRQGVHAVTIWCLVGWLPGKPTWQGTNYTEIIRFGSLITLSNLSSTLGRQLDKVLLGWQHGTAELGYYAIAYTVTMAPVINIATPIAGLAIPYLADASERNRDQVEIAGYLVVIMGTLFSPFIWLAIEAEAVTSLIFGDDWLPSVPMLRVLSLFAFASALQYPLVWILMIRNLTRRYTVWHIVYTIALLVSVVIGLDGGGRGIALAQTTVATAFLAVLPAFVAASLKLRILAYYPPLVAVIAFLICASLVCLTADSLLPATHAIFRLLISATLFFGTTALLTLLFYRLHLSKRTADHPA